MTKNTKEEDITRLIRFSIESIGKLKLGLPKHKKSSLLPEFEKYTNEQLKQIFSLQDLIRESMKKVANFKLGEPKTKSNSKFTKEYAKSLSLQNVIRKSIQNVVKFKLGKPNNQIPEDLQKLIEQVKSLPSPSSMANTEQLENAQDPSDKNAALDIYLKNLQNIKNSLNSINTDTDANNLLKEQLLKELNKSQEKLAPLNKHTPISPPPVLEPKTPAKQPVQPTSKPDKKDTIPVAIPFGKPVINPNQSTLSSENSNNLPNFVPFGTGNTVNETNSSPNPTPGITTNNQVSFGIATTDNNPQNKQIQTPSTPYNAQSGTEANQKIINTVDTYVNDVLLTTSKPPDSTELPITPTLDGTTKSPVSIPPIDESNLQQLIKDVNIIKKETPDFQPGETTPIVNVSESTPKTELVNELANKLNNGSPTIEELKEIIVDGIEKITTDENVSLATVSPINTTSMATAPDIKPVADQNTTNLAETSTAIESKPQSPEPVANLTEVPNKHTKTLAESLLTNIINNVMEKLSKKPDEPTSTETLPTENKEIQKEIAEVVKDVVESDFKQDFKFVSDLSTIKGDPNKYFEEIWEKYVQIRANSDSLDQNIKSIAEKAFTESINTDAILANKLNKYLTTGVPDDSMKSQISESIQKLTSVSDEEQLQLYKFLYPRDDAGYPPTVTNVPASTTNQYDNLPEEVKNQLENVIETIIKSGDNSIGENITNLEKEVVAVVESLVTKKEDLYDIIISLMNTESRELYNKLSDDNISEDEFEENVSAYDEHNLKYFNKINKDLIDSEYENDRLKKGIRNKLFIKNNNNRDTLNKEQFLRAIGIQDTNPPPDNRTFILLTVVSIWNTFKDNFVNNTVNNTDKQTIRFNYILTNIYYHIEHDL